MGGPTGTTGGIRSSGSTAQPPAAIAHARANLGKRHANFISSTRGKKGSAAGSEPRTVERGVSTDMVIASGRGLRLDCKGLITHRLLGVLLTFASAAACAVDPHSGETGSGGAGGEAGMGGGAAGTGGSAGAGGAAGAGGTAGVPACDPARATPDITAPSPLVSVGKPVMAAAGVQ